METVFPILSNIMEFTNLNGLLANAASEPTGRVREAALKLLKAGVEAADPKACIKDHVKLEEGKLKVGKRSFDLSRVRRIFVVGGGKASGQMAKVLEEVLGARITGGVVNVLHGTSKMFRVERIRLNEAGHPIPDKRGVKSVRRMVELLEEAGRQPSFRLNFRGRLSPHAPPSRRSESSRQAGGRKPPTKVWSTHPSS